MIENPWNNLLHGQVEAIVNEAINILVLGSNELVTSSLFSDDFNVLSFIAAQSAKETTKPG